MLDHFVNVLFSQLTISFSERGNGANLCRRMLSFLEKEAGLGNGYVRSNRLGQISCHFLPPVGSMHRRACTIKNITGL